MPLRRGLTAMLCLCLCLAAGTALAQAGPLTAEEMHVWCDSLWHTLQTLSPQNDPAQTNDPDGADTWLFAYPFGVAELTAPSPDGEANPIAEVEVLTDAVACPRGIVVGDPLEKVLAAYPNDNPSLAGDARYAALYVQEKASSGSTGWGWLLRRNRTVEGAEYAVSTPAAGMEGFVTEATLLYVITDGQVSAIRAGGFAQLVSAEESAANLAAVREIAGRDRYIPSESAGDAAFSAEDLTFAGVAFRTATPEAAVEALGAPLSDTTDTLFGVRTLTYTQALAEFIDMDGVWQMAALLVSDGELPGPGDVRIGDTLDSVVERLGEGEMDETLTYVITDEDGYSYALSCTFFDDVLTEYLLYRL